MTISAGSVELDLGLNIPGLQSDISKAEGLTRSAASKLSITAKVDADLSKLNARVSEAQTKLNAIKAKQVELGADGSKLDRSVARAEAELTRLQGKRAQAVIDADLSKLTSSVNSAESSLAAISGRRVEAQIGGDNSGLLAEIGAAESELDALQGRSVTVPITADISGLTSQLQGDLTGKLGGMGNYLAPLLGSAGPAGLAVAGLGAAFVGTTAAAASWQGQMTDVSRTTGVSGAALGTMSNDLQQLRMDYGLTAQAASSAAEVAGSMGVGDEFSNDLQRKQQEIVEYVGTASQVSLAWGMASEKASGSIGSVGAVTRDAMNEQRQALGQSEMDWSEYASRLGSSIDVLGNQYNTSEEKMAEAMSSMSMTQMLSQLKPDEDSFQKWLGLAAVMTSTGSTGAGAGQAIGDALRYAKKDSEDFMSSLAGMSKMDFQLAMGDDSIGTLEMLAQKIASLPLDQQEAAYAKFGDTGAAAIKALATNHEMYTKTVDDSSKAWKENTSLINSFGAKMGDANTQASRVWQTMTVGAEKLGNVALPLVTAGLSGLADSLQVAIALGEQFFEIGSTAADWGSSAATTAANAAGNTGNWLSEGLNSITGGALGYNELEDPNSEVYKRYHQNLQTATGDAIADGAVAGAEKAGPQVADAIAEPFHSALDAAYDDFLKKKVSKEIASARAYGGATSDETALAILNNSGLSNTRQAPILQATSEYAGLPGLDPYSVQKWRQYHGAEFNEYYSALDSSGRKLLENLPIDTAAKETQEELYKSWIHGAQPGIIDANRYFKVHTPEIKDQISAAWKDGTISGTEKLDLENLKQSLETLKANYSVEFDQAGLQTQLTQVDELIQGHKIDLEVEIKSAWKDWSSEAYQQKWQYDHPEVSSRLNPGQAEQLMSNMGRLQDIIDSETASKNEKTQAEEVLQAYENLLEGVTAKYNYQGVEDTSAQIIAKYDASQKASNSPTSALIYGYQGSAADKENALVGGDYLDYSYRSKYITGQFGDPYTSSPVSSYGTRFGGPELKTTETNTGDTADATKDLKQPTDSIDTNTENTAAATRSISNYSQVSATATQASATALGVASSALSRMDGAAITTNSLLSQDLIVDSQGVNLLAEINNNIGAIASRPGNTYNYYGATASAASQQNNYNAIKKMAGGSAYYGFASGGEVAGDQIIRVGEDGPANPELIFPTAPGKQRYDLLSKLFRYYKIPGYANGGQIGDDSGYFNGGYIAGGPVTDARMSSALGTLEASKIPGNIGFGKSQADIDQAMNIARADINQQVRVEGDWLSCKDLNTEALEISSSHTYDSYVGESKGWAGPGKGALPGYESEDYYTREAKKAAQQTSALTTSVNTCTSSVSNFSNSLSSATNLQSRAMAVITASMPSKSKYPSYSVYDSLISQDSADWWTKDYPALTEADRPTWTTPAGYRLKDIQMGRVQDKSLTQDWNDYTKALEKYNAALKATEENYLACNNAYSEGAKLQERADSGRFKGGLAGGYIGPTAYYDPTTGSAKPGYDWANDLFQMKSSPSYLGMDRITPEMIAARDGLRATGSSSLIANENLRRVSSASGLTSSAFGDLASKANNLTSAYGQAYAGISYVSNGLSKLGNGLGSYADQSAPMVVQGGLAKTIKGTQTEFEKFEFSLGQCAQYITDEGIRIEADSARFRREYAGPTSSYDPRTGGALPGYEADNDFAWNPSNQWAIDEAARRGMEPYAGTAQSEAEAAKAQAEAEAKGTSTIPSGSLFGDLASTAQNQYQETTSYQREALSVADVTNSRLGYVNQGLTQGNTLANRNIGYATQINSGVGLVAAKTDLVKGNVDVTNTKLDALPDKIGYANAAYMAAAFGGGRGGSRPMAVGGGGSYNDPFAVGPDAWGGTSISGGGAWVGSGGDAEPAWGGENASAGVPGDYGSVSWYAEGGFADEPRIVGVGDVPEFITPVPQLKATMLEAMRDMFGSPRSSSGPAAIPQINLTFAPVIYGAQLDESGLKRVIVDQKRDWMDDVEVKISTIIEKFRESRR